MMGGVVHLEIGMAIVAGVAESAAPHGGRRVAEPTGR